MLSFAGIPPGQVLAISKPQQFAEKIHAYTFPWNDRVNMRSKDLVDLVLLIETGSVKPADVIRAIKATFACRRTHDVPAVLLTPPAIWAGEFSAIAAEAQVKASTLASAFETLQAFWIQTHF